MGKVYIVHCIDTEGPLYETLEATFERLRNIFEIEIEPTEENLRKLQEERISLGGKEKEVSKALDNSLLSTFRNFSDIEKMLQKLNGKAFREGLLDSSGKGWVCSWFCMEHVGFQGENPRMRVAGWHSIYDWYVNKIEYSLGDIVGWHYHPLPVNGDYNACGVNYVGSGNVFEILARNVIDRQFFPAIYRPGFHTERPDSHWLLEQWIPFDYANQSVLENVQYEQRDMKNGRLGNWVGAPTSWEPYHPDYADYRKKGDCKRVIARCLNMNTRMRNITPEDFEQAFAEAESGESQLVSFTDHDFRDICYDVDLMRKMLTEVIYKYPEVQFEFCNALEGMRKYFNLEAASCNLSVELQNERKCMSITADKNIFGTQPFFCVKLFGGRYVWSNLDFIDDNKWSFTFDRDSVELDQIEKIGIAANSTSGVTDIIVIEIRTGAIQRKVLNS